MNTESCNEIMEIAKEVVVKIDKTVYPMTQVKLLALIFSMKSYLDIEEFAPDKIANEIIDLLVQIELRGRL